MRRRSLGTRADVAGGDAGALRVHVQLAEPGAEGQARLALAPVRRASPPALGVHDEGTDLGGGADRLAGQPTDATRQRRSFLPLAESDARRRRSVSPPGLGDREADTAPRPAPMTGLLIWVALAGPLWAIAGAALLPRRYRGRRADPRLAGLAGGLWGAALGPLVLGWLHRQVPACRRGPHVILPALFLAGELAGCSSVRFRATPASATASTSWTRSRPA